MYIEKHIPNRQKDEKLVLFLRRHWLAIFSHILMYLIFALIPIGAYFFLTNFQPQIPANKYLYPPLFLLASLYYLYILLFLYIVDQFFLFRAL